MSIEKSNIANNILDNIKSLEGLRTDAELARVLGKKPNVISTWRKRNAPDWNLIFEKFDHIPKHKLFSTSNEKSIEDVEFVDLPFYASVKASAGQGIVADQEKTPLTIKFRSYYIKNTLKSSASSLFGMKIDGDSMYPVLKSGDLVLVNQEKRNPDDHNIFAVRIDQDVYCKYVLRLPGNRFKLASANSLYPPIEVNAQDYNFGILGRLVHLSRTL